MRRHVAERVSARLASARVNLPGMRPARRLLAVVLSVPLIVACSGSSATREEDPDARPPAKRSNDPAVRLVAGPVVLFTPASGRYSPAYVNVYIRLNRDFPTRGSYEDEDGAQKPRTAGFIELVGGVADLAAGSPFALSPRRHCYQAGWEPGPALSPLRDGQQVTIRVFARRQEVAEAKARARQAARSKVASEKMERQILAQLGCRKPVK